MSANESEKMKPKITYIQGALRFAGRLTLPDLSNSIGVAGKRYIQSVYETPEYRNPDTLIRDLLPPPVRWLSMLQAKIQLSKLRQDPFYSINELFSAGRIEMVPVI
jgi:hypothetical protein